MKEQEKQDFEARRDQAEDKGRRFVCEAFHIAISAHGNKGDDSGLLAVWHPITVAQSMAKRDWIGQATALLHDTVEDTITSLEDIQVSLGVVDQKWAGIVADAVDALSRRDGEDYFDYITRAVQNTVALRVKEADLNANLRRGNRRGYSEKDMRKLRARYLKALGVVMAVKKVSK